MRKTEDDINRIISEIRFLDRIFRLLPKGEGWLLQIGYWEPDVDTGIPTLQRSRKWYISPWMTESEIVSTAWACCERSHRHVAAEGFTYCGLRIFSPHMDVDARLNIADPDRLDVRPDDRKPFKEARSQSNVTVQKRPDLRFPDEYYEEAEKPYGWVIEDIDESGNLIGGMACIIWETKDEALEAATRVAPLPGAKVRFFPLYRHAARQAAAGGGGE